jgi:hypothetical protein
MAQPQLAQTNRAHQKRRGNQIPCDLPCLSLDPRPRLYQQDDVVAIDATPLEPIGASWRLGYQEGVLAWDFRKPAKAFCWIDRDLVPERGVVPL